MSQYSEKVYALVTHIPPGRLLSYGRVALLIDVPGSAQAVGWALHRLDLERGVPWHRVLNGKGYISTSCLEHTATIQRERLEAEGVIFDERGIVDMKHYLWPVSFWEAQTLIEAALGLPAAFRPADPPTSD